MGEVSYIYYLSSSDYIIVNFYSSGNQVYRFVINYVALIHGQEVSIRRYDSYHGKPHLDVYKNPVFRKSGHEYVFKEAEQEKVWLEGDKGEIMRRGRDDIIENWKKYKQQYVNSISYK